MTMVRFAAHVHSTWSYDGTCSLDEVASVFRRFGYDGVLMSEHSRTFDQERWEAYRAACQKASRGILLVPGIEYEDDSNTVHVLVWGDLPFIESHSSTGETLRGVRSHHGIAVLAHPRRKDALDPSAPQTGRCSTESRPGTVETTAGRHGFVRATCSPTAQASWTSSASISIAGSTFSRWLSG